MADSIFNDTRGVADYDLAAWLRAQRQRAGFNQRDVCERTKIHIKFIQALESGEYAVLPSQAHVRSFALSFAKACDADLKKAGELVALALGRPVSVDGVAPGPSASEGVRASSGGGQASASPLLRSTIAQDEEPGRWTLWFGMAVGVALVLWVLTRLTAPAIKSASLLPSSKVKPAAAAASAKKVIKKKPIEKKLKKKKIKKISKKVSRVQKNMPPLSLAAGGENDQALTLRAQSNCWLVVRVDGKREPVVILAANEKKVWYFKQRLVMLAGNAGALKLWWRGKSVSRLGKMGERKNGLVFEKGQAMRQVPEAALELPSGIQALKPAGSGG